MSCPSFHSLPRSLPVALGGSYVPPWNPCWWRWNCCSRPSRLFVSPPGPANRKIFCDDRHAHNLCAVDISYENLIGVLADQVDTQFEVAIGAFCLA